MGLRFRKSFGVGPFRATLSKSGISFSAGVKGARITKKANGNVSTSFGVPGTGIYHYKEYPNVGKQPRQTTQPKYSKRQTEQMALSQIQSNPDNWYDLISFTSIDEKELFILCYYAGIMNKYTNGQTVEVSVEEICIPFKIADVNNIAANSNLPRNCTSARLTTMVDKGWLIKEGRGIYKLNAQTIYPYLKQWVNIQEQEKERQQQELEALQRFNAKQEEGRRRIALEEQEREVVYHNEARGINMGKCTGHKHIRKIIAIISCFFALGMYGVPSLLCKQYKLFGISWAVMIFIALTFPNDFGAFIAFVVCCVTIPIISIKNIK